MISLHKFDKMKKKWIFQYYIKTNETLYQMIIITLYNTYRCAHYFWVWFCLDAHRSQSFWVMAKQHVLYLVNRYLWDFDVFPYIHCIVLPNVTDLWNYNDINSSVIVIYGINCIHIIAKRFFLIQETEYSIQQQRLLTTPFICQNVKLTETSFEYKFQCKIV